MWIIICHNIENSVEQLLTIEKNSDVQTEIQNVLQKLQDKHSKEFINIWCKSNDFPKSYLYQEKHYTNYWILLVRYLYKETNYNRICTLFVKHYKKFQTNSQIIKEYVLNLYIKILRRLVYEKKYTLITQLLDLKIYSKIEFTDNYVDILFTKAAILVVINKIEEAFQIYLEIYKNTNCRYRLQKAAFFIGTYYININDIEESKVWFHRATIFKNRIWGLMAKIMLNEPIRILSINDIQVTEPISDGDQHFMKIVQYLNKNDIFNAYNIIFSIKKKSFLHISTRMLKSLKTIINQQKALISWRLGSVIYKYSGRIIAELFPIIQEIKKVIKNENFQEQVIALIASIIETETKHIRYNDQIQHEKNPAAHGLMQVTLLNVAPYAKKYKIKINKKILEENDEINVFLGTQMLKHIKEDFVKELLFIIYYYHSGTVSWTLKKSISHLDLSNPINIFVILDLIEKNIGRFYVEHVLEFFIILYTMLHKKNPQPTFWIDEFLFQ